MQPPNVVPSPKQRFQESANNISHHRELIQRNEFQRACDFAMMQYQGELTAGSTDNFNVCAAAHLKITGALEFLRVFRLLGEQVIPGPKIVDRDNLTHQS